MFLINFYYYAFGVMHSQISHITDPGAFILWAMNFVVNYLQLRWL